jgi:hypothetical protein
MQKSGFNGSVGISSVNAVDVGPDDEFFGVHDVGNDRTGKIGAIASERGNAAVGSRPDEAGDDRDETSIEKRQKSGTAASASFFEMRLGVAECVAGKNEIGRGNGDRGDSGFFESGSEETSAEAFAKRGKTISEFSGGGNVAS